MEMIEEGGEARRDQRKGDEREQAEKVGRGAREVEKCLSAGRIPGRGTNDDDVSVQGGSITHTHL